jgi:hypothetical protein
MKCEINELCNVYIVGRVSGDIVYESSGHNVWTNTGREYSCLLKTCDENGEPYRSDKIMYIGVGIGNQTESVSVDRLANPIAYDSSSKWLKKIDHRKTMFTAGDLRTAVRYSATFSYDELSIGSQQMVQIRECGLFTDGSNNAPFTRGARDLMLSSAAFQSPVAYHSFDPIPKTPNLELEIIWELRH